MVVYKRLPPLGEDELRAELGDANLAFGRWLDRERGWFVACPS